jgi:hypothetical protein
MLIMHSLWLLSGRAFSASIRPSSIESAMVGSAIWACQLLTGSCLVQSALRAVVRDGTLTEPATSGDLTLGQPEGMKSESFFNLAHGHLFCGNLFPPPFSGGQAGRCSVRRRFGKLFLEFDSGERDHHSGDPPFLIGIIPES